MAGEKLPDIMGPDLGVVFVGASAGKRSAEAGHYYSNGGNRFYRWLHETGFTPNLLKPTDDHLLPVFGIGLTDLSKTYAGMDGSEEQSDSFDCKGLIDRLTTLRPKVVAFAGKLGVEASFGSFIGYFGDVHFGPQDWAVGESLVFVLPSTSSANPATRPLKGVNGLERPPVDYWHGLAAFLDR
ncbi:mismatch-specific DNA-glycosylase [Arthrobacter antibioticus]|uniref:mismatch-specific DNA-glycosylase n=1 Tax=Arthrobacter sp. H35-MC1 TaxID=3046203 RepID=UPI0024BBB32C|nr:mismatch-specific DNA-glycosylase [Arthrobacter sp. H35-MC1]MDJ0317640.1 mismatch-specific DNA-glycosylase [Arthrobacter sp. H35-MC1]